MEITDVRLKKINTSGKMKAIASITIDNEFVVHEIKVIDSLKRENRRAMPVKEKRANLMILLTLLRAKQEKK